MSIADTISHVPGTEFFQHRGQSLRLVQAIHDDSKSFHQSLRLHEDVRPEKRPKRGIESEKIPIERERRHVRRIRHFGKSVTDPRYLVRIH